MTAEVRIGPAGWSYEDWKGRVYPAGESGFDPLAYLSRFFDTIEVNSTFYRPPAPKSVESWVRRTEHNPRFRFTAKLWQHFTHDPREIDPAAVKTYRDALAPLVEADRLGAVLCQFPWSFKGGKENARYLNRLFEAFEGLPLSLEVRHASWDTPQVYDWLRRKGVAFCNIDQPVIGKSLEATSEATTSVGYLRLHGQNRDAWFSREADVNQRYDYLYDPEELEPWAETVERIQDGLEQIYIVFNNHFQGKAAANALEMAARLFGGPVDVPPDLLAAYPRLEAVALG